MTITQKVITVTTAGTIVQAAATAPTANGGNVNKIMFQAYVGNTGRIHVGISTPTSATPGTGFSTASGLIKSLAKDPGTAGVMDSWFLEDQGSDSTLDPTVFWIDATVSGEKVVMTMFQR